LSTGFGWSKGGKVTSAEWQITLRDPIWYVISRSGEVSLHTVLSCHGNTDRNSPCLMHLMRLNKSLSVEDRNPRENNSDSHTGASVDGGNLTRSVLAAGHGRAGLVAVRRPRRLGRGSTASDCEEAHVPHDHTTAAVSLHETPGETLHVRTATTDDHS